MRSRMRGGFVVACVVLAATACTFDRQVIAVPVSQVVVHGVLDPGDTLVDVLVERTLTGTITVPRQPRYDILDPINTSGGVPARGAQVSITGPAGVTPGLEVRYPGKPATYGAGRYVFRRLVVQPGGKYTLNIRTADGIVVTGSTLVPMFTPDLSAPVPFGGLFRRDLDTLDVTWSSVPNARTYGLRVESPFGAFQLFSDSTHVRLAGNLRNLFAEQLPRVFIPGFQQVATVYAADTNFFDYYRSRNDPFTGSGIINRLEGGIGLFGSTVTITSRMVEVTQATTDPSFEGRYQLVGGSAAARAFVNTILIYVETPATAILGASLSGWYSPDPVGYSHDGILGTRDADRIELHFLTNQNARIERATFIGKQSNDSLSGTLTSVNGFAEQVVFRKLATP
jgi:hypothetical protein